MKTDKDRVAGFYDEFAAQQEKIGVNSRHLQILDKLVKAGLKSHHKVLEVGCGIGTVSQLIAQKVTKGSVLAVDISPESIAKAKKIWESFDNLAFEVSDMKGFFKEETYYDFVVFPDVLEHIPVENHFSLFQTIKRHSHGDTVIFIHIPAPRFLEWMIRNEPLKLQVIDQPLDSGDLVKNITANGFFLEKMETYSIFYKEHDYQYFIFKSQKPLEKVTHRNKWDIFKERAQIRLKHRIIG
ncbi:SAM-dependent methyltransferase [Negadavirga shengliensis]|uniref:SAM-dependent methyltransferase n=1 Tax=Negadavirga shengliensis TaxID=1389218 RepID=A0ABV9T448_9BACT